MSKAFIMWGPLWWDVRQFETNNSVQRIVVKFFFIIEPSHKIYIQDIYKSQLCCDCDRIMILLYLEGLRKQFALQSDC